MHPRMIVASCVLFSLLFASIVNAEATLQTLQSNPFSRPAILKAKPRPQVQPKKVVLPPEEIKLDLTATMVSEISPMVVVDGELLAIGEKIEGLKLIAVMEGKAIFAQGGKKFSFTVDDGDDGNQNRRRTN